MPRIIFNNTNVDVLIDEDSLQTEYNQERSQKRSTSGKIQTINQHGIQEMRFSAVLTEALYRRLIAWWAWARQGKVWAFAFDSTKTGNTTLDDPAAAGQKVIPLTGTGDFSAEDYCLIRAADNDDEFEVVEIASISAGVSVTAVDNLVYSYTSGDIFRHWEYWPEVVSLEDKFGPLKKDGTYRHVFRFAEKL